MSSSQILMAHVEATAWIQAASRETTTRRMRCENIDRELQKPLLGLLGLA